MKVLIGLVEHIGDIVACEPVARYLKRKYPGCTLSWVVNARYRDLIDSNPNVDETVIVDCLTDWIKVSRHGRYDYITDLHLNYRGCSHCGIPLVKTHGNPFVNAFEWFDHGALLEAFSIGAGLPKLSAAPRLYLSDTHVKAVDTRDLPKHYCVIHRESDSERTVWIDDNWRALAEWIARELRLPIVEIGVGKDRPSPLTGRAIDLRGKTSILEAAEVIRRARFFVGVDSGPAHLANAARVPGIVLLGQMGTCRQYTPYTGFYGSDAPDVKLVRSLNGPARELSLQEVVDNVRYVNNILLERKGAGAAPTAEGNAEELEVGAGFDGNVDERDRQDVLASPFFDGAWYSIHYPEVDASGLSPIDHYLLIGGARGYAPGPEFDSAAYLDDYRDVTSAGANPLLHYIRDGAREGRVLRSATHSASGPKSAISLPSSADENAVGLSSAIDCGDVRLVTNEIADDEIPRTFAFYLPQFHPIAENDWAHGKGFTEWNNVVKTKPLFNGHYQPRIPGELGYYDLRAAEVMDEQIRLALEHGITGFCFYYYYFHGKKLLYKPIENYVKSSHKAPFFFLWANENWSKRWDGGDKEVIIAQQHSREDDLAFIRELFPLFEDGRYTKIGGRPLLMIYKAYLFPNMRATVETWRDEAAKRGFPGLYLVMVDDWTPEPIHPRTLGFDASYEIPSNVMPSDVLFDDAQSLGLQDDFTGRIVDYQKFAQFHMSRPFPEYRRFRTVMLPWDNTPRYGSRAIIHVNTVGEGYKLWLSQALLDTYSRYPAQERIVLLHSWNEWCEGTYLEPDGRVGRRYLEQTKDAINDVKTVLAIGGTEKHARAFELLKRIQARKDEAAFRMLQAAHIKQVALGQERDRLQDELAALKQSVTESDRSGASTRSVKSASGRMRRKLGELLGF